MEKYIFMNSALMLCLSTLTPRAQAGDGNLWLGMAAVVCIAQDGNNGRLPLARRMLTEEKGAAPAVEKMSGALAACRQQPASQDLSLPQPLCEAVLSDPDGKVADVAGLSARYADKLQALQQLGKCGAR